MSTKKGVDENDVPPLEDMSELVEQARQLQQQKEKPTTSTTSSTSSKTSGSNTSSVQDSDQGNKGTESQAKNDVAEKTPKKEETKRATKPKSEGSFGGFKKGFLFGAPPAKSSAKVKGQPKAKSSAPPKQDKGSTPAKESDDIPLIKPKVRGQESVTERVPGFIEAIKQSLPGLKSDEWLTDEFVKRIEEHPRLARQLADPVFTEALTMFQRDPETAAKSYADDEDIQTFFSEFFEVLGGQAVARGQPDPPTPAQKASMEEAAQVKRMLSEPEVREALNNPRIKQLLQLLKTDPDRAQWMVKTADAELREHLRIMVDRGLLALKNVAQ